MKVSFFILVSALGATLAAPNPAADEDQPLEERTTGTGLIQFYYDENCDSMNLQSEIYYTPPGHDPVIIGGKWGTRSARFIAIGSMQHWVIQTNDKNKKGTPIGEAQQPPVGKCIHFSNQGIEAWGTYAATVHP